MYGLRIFQGNRQNTNLLVQYQFFLIIKANINFNLCQKVTNMKIIYTWFSINPEFEGVFEHICQQLHSKYRQTYLRLQPKEFRQVIYAHHTYHISNCSVSLFSNTILLWYTRHCILGYNSTLLKVVCKRSYKLTAFIIFSIILFFTIIP